MPSKNTEFIRAARRQAVLSALVSGGWLVLTAALLLLARWIWRPEGVLSTVLLVLSIGELCCLVPLAFSLRSRLKEIQGGEEYEARQY